MKILIVSILLFGCIGCESIDNALFDKQITPETVSTNEAGVVVLRAAQTNYVARPIIQTTIDSTGALPVPAAGFLPILLGWLYSAVRSHRNKKSAQALVTGIEAVRRVLQETEDGQKFDRKLKGIVKEHQVAAGVASEVAKLVARYTEPTTQNRI